MEISKKEMLEKLQYLSVAASAKNNNLQMDCVVFDGKRFHTFNDDIAVSVKAPEGLAGLEPFAVKFKEFYAFVLKWPRDEMEFTLTDSHVVLKSKRSKARIVREAEILMPYKEWGSVKPKAMKNKLGSEFAEGLALVWPICGKDSTQPITTCVWLWGSNVLGTDNYSMGRYKLKEQYFPDELLHLPAVAASAASKFPILAYEIGRENDWIHFAIGDKNHEACMSCRLLLCEYHDFERLENLLNEKGVEFTLPAKIEEILNRASVITRDDSTVSSDQFGELVHVRLENNLMIVSTSSSVGDYQELQRIDYDGEEIEFYVNAGWLCEAVKKRRNMMVCERFVCMCSKDFDYIVACQEMPRENEDSAEESTPDNDKQPESNNSQDYDDVPF